jgi:hypothetical protein
VHRHHDSSTSSAAAAAASASVQSSFKRDAVQKLFDQVGLKAIVGMMRYDDEVGLYRC